MAALRPLRSPYRPSRMPPTGRMKKPTPNTAAWTAGAWNRFQCGIGRSGGHILQALAQRCFVKVLPDEHQARTALLALAPGAVEMVVEAAAHALQQPAHGLARDVGKALDTQDAVLLHQRLQRGQQAVAGPR